MFSMSSSYTSDVRLVKENEWVRLQRGAYKGDLGLVKFVRESGQKCVVQFVPRLDLTLSDLPLEQARVRRRTIRPPQKFFNSQEVAAMGKQTMRQRFPGLDIFCDVFEGNYYHEGYQLKEMTVGTMVKKVTEETPPTLDELQSFRKASKSVGEDDDGEENEGSKLAGSLLDELSELQGKTGLTKAKTSGGGGLLIGDTVEVIEGDLIGLRGKLINLDGSTVKVKPITNKLELPEEVEFLASQVRKYIAVGAHVKVMDGRYANETGNVVAVEQLEGEADCTAVVLTDVTNKEITVRTSQLRESAEIASGQDKLAGYELYDLVVLSGGGSSNEVGVIVRVGREDFTVINNHGLVREVRPEELRGKRNQGSNRAIAVDVQGNQIRVGDQVTVTEGPHKGKQATIKRMSRTQLFLFSQTRTENAGIFVVRSRSCMQAGSRSLNRGSAGDGGASPFSTPRTQTGGGGIGPRGKHDDALIGKSVRIQAGQWKGYVGTVSDATATHVQVELHSRLKKVMVVRERVVVAGDKFGSTEDPSRSQLQQSSMLAPTTPFITGGATPMHGGATPMHGGATPMHDTSGGEEVWRPGGSLDQDAAENEDGWGSTSKEQSNPFGSSDGEAVGGWGSSHASTWAPSSVDDIIQTNTPASAPTAVKVEEVHEHSTSEIKREKVEADAMGGDGDETPVWFMERVCVMLKSDQSEGIIKEINGSAATLELEGGLCKSVRVSELSMVEPKEHDIVLVTGGADVGVEGELVCIDGTDAILKDAKEDFKIVDFVHLAKISSDA
jgi:transcription elongation factor SPT5